MVYKKNLKDKLTRHLNVKIASTSKERHMHMGSEVAVLLGILGDGKWHGLAELQHEMGMAEYKVQEIAAFLSRFDFAVVDEANRKVKVNRDFQKLLART
jgi:hypothetical protein